MNDYNNEENNVRIIDEVKANKYIEMENEKKANTLCTVSQIFFYSPYILFLIEIIIPNDVIFLLLGSPFSKISLLIGFTLMVYVRIKYPNNKISKRIMKTYIITIAITLLYIFFVIMTCYYICSNMKLPG